ncbi:hypothetical protein [Vulcanisaeta distributa]|uniref:hypothetical protein n=1 Tax=Vulcanisaeta distributa TaxID=164451 RepID=UPI000B294627|nr:hypothetical protein [Vulcanisaeta distributa]
MIIISRVTESESITIIILLTGLEGFHIVTPKLLDDSKLKAAQYGLLLTDGTIHRRGYPVMNTNHLWQVIAWLLAWPGENHVYITQREHQ